MGCASRRSDLADDRVRGVVRLLADVRLQRVVLVHDLHQPLDLVVAQPVFLLEIDEGVLEGLAHRREGLGGRLGVDGPVDERPEALLLQDVEERAAFEKLSIALYEVVKSNGGNEMAIYKIHCPMAFDNKGAYWLSEEKEVKNPYFGDKMLDCGEVEEELAAK